MRTVFFTGHGDKGKTGFGAKKLKKTDILFAALGAIDRLNVMVGWCASEAKKEGRKTKEIEDSLIAFQEMLFIMQAELAAYGFRVKGKYHVGEEMTEKLETVIRRADKRLPPLTKFVLPGGSELASRLELARVSARDAERSVLGFVEGKKANAEWARSLNRSSSFFFALARLVNAILKEKERHPSYGRK
jgi:cob(I)alamin adenosyltransferase